MSLAILQKNAVICKNKTYHDLYSYIEKTMMSVVKFFVRHLSVVRWYRDLRSSLVIYDVFVWRFACSVFVQMSVFAGSVRWLCRIHVSHSAGQACFDATGVDVNTATHLLCQTTKHQLFFNTQVLTPYINLR